MATLSSPTRCGRTTRSPPIGTSLTAPAVVCRSWASGARTRTRSSVYQSRRKTTGPGPPTSVARAGPTTRARRWAGPAATTLTRACSTWTLTASTSPSCTPRPCSHGWRTPGCSGPRAGPTTTGCATTARRRPAGCTGSVSSRSRTSVPPWRRCAVAPSNSASRRSCSARPPIAAPTSSTTPTTTRSGGRRPRWAARSASTRRPTGTCPTRAACWASPKG
jgi:hypothetical protein